MGMLASPMKELGYKNKIMLLIHHANFMQGHSKSLGVSNYASRIFKLI